MAMQVLAQPASDQSTDFADDVLIRRPEQARLAGGVSIDTIKRWEREGLCPAPVKIGPRLSGQWRRVWLAWLSGRKKTA